MKIKTVSARKLHAGNYLVLHEGSVRKYYHICEVHIDKEVVDIVFDNVRHSRFYKRYAPLDKVEIRDHDSA
jgi:hypothetical protein